ncbi:MAG: VTT domain-containing protein [Marmoricola sp.]
MSFLWSTFGFGLLSAVIPIFNMEVYVVAIYKLVPHNWFYILLIAFVGSLGQNIGKLVWYYAAEGALRIKWIEDRLRDPERQQSIEKWRSRVEGRPVFSGFLAFTSAATGIPPITAMAPVAGVLRMNVAIFFFAGLVGRTLFLWAILIGAGAVFHLF